MTALADAPIAQAISQALLHFVWQGMLVVIALWITLFAMRRRSAASRYAVSCAALGLMAILPAITAYVLYQRPQPFGARGPSETAGQFVAVATSGTAPGWLALVQAWAVPVWCCGVLLFSIRLMWASHQVSKLRRRGEPAEATLLATVARLADRLGLRRGVQILISSIADGPSVVGVLRPVILLPAATLLGLAPQQLEAVLAHELAHIRRYDYLVNIVQMMIEALLFYHPAVWWTSARIRRERELCCDDAAVAVCGDSLGYARALASLERLRATAPSLALASTDGPLAFRIKRLIGASASEERLPSKLPGVLALCLALACLSFSINRVHGQASQQASQQEPRLAVAILPPDAGRVMFDFGTLPLLHGNGNMRVEYPAEALNKGVSGIVTAEVRLDQSGNVSDGRILSGPDELRKYVLQTVLGWHFAPEIGGTTQVIRATFQLPTGARPSAGKQQPAEDQAQLTQRILEEERRALERDFQRNACDTPECSAQAARLALERVVASLEEKLRAAQAAGDPQGQFAIQRALDQAKRESLALAGTPFGDRQQSAIADTADFLKAQRAEMQARLAQLKTLEAQLQRLQATQAAGSREEVDRQIVQTNAQLTELVTKIERVETAQRALQTAPFEGRTLKSIQVLGVGIPTEDFLAKVNLPVSVGDTLPQGSVEATIAAVKKFDEHLAILWLRVEPMAVMLQIVAPGASAVPGGRGGRGGGPGPGAAEAPPAPPLEPGVTPPVVVQRVDPEYPKEARAAKWQGTVILSVLVGKNGVPNDIKVTRQVGMGLEQSALKAVWNWRFQPAMKDGNPVEYLTQIEVPFRLPAN
jgi:TonB family protein